MLLLLLVVVVVRYGPTRSLACRAQIIYHGPQSRVVRYFEEMGLSFPPDQDVADFITEFISDPRDVYKRQVRRLAAEGLSSSAVPPLTTGTCDPADFVP